MGVRKRVGVEREVEVGGKKVTFLPQKRRLLMEKRYFRTSTDVPYQRRAESELRIGKEARNHACQDSHAIDGRG